MKLLNLAFIEFFQLDLDAPVASPVVYLAGRVGTHERKRCMRSYLVRILAMLAVLTAWAFYLSVPAGFSSRYTQTFETVWLRVDGISLLWQAAFCCLERWSSCSPVRI